MTLRQEFNVAPNRTSTTRIAVVTLVQKQDFPTAWSSLATIDPQLSLFRHRFVLVNDTPDSALVERLQALPYTDVIEVGHNLGVARGRNMLLASALKWGADLIVTIDDDILVPSDYLGKVEMLMGRDASPADIPDIATPVLLDYHAVAKGLHDENQINSIETGDVQAFMQSLTILQVLAAWQSLEDKSRINAVHHMGIREWERHYFGPLGGVARKLDRAIADVTVDLGVDPGVRPPTELRSDPEAVASAVSGMDDRVIIDCAPGGSTIFRRSALETLGLLDEAFSPFGYEDAEICIRAQRAGLRVALLESLLLLHDLQSRHKLRDPLVTTATRGKARALLIRRHGGDPSQKASLVFESLVMGVFESSMYTHVDGGPLAALFAFVAGVLSGLFARVTEQTGESKRSGSRPSFVRLGRPDIYLTDALGNDGLIPRVFSGSVPFSIRVHAVPVASSLPSGIAGRADATYSLDESRNLRIALSLHVPGLLDLRLRARLSGPPYEGASWDDPLAGTRLHWLDLRVLDNGLLDRFESSRAWLGGWPSRGILRSLAASLPGRDGAVIRSFLDPWHAPRTLQLSIEPIEPVSYGDLIATDGGTWHLMRRLGIRLRTDEDLASSRVGPKGVKT